jgi:hypothetical protein
MADSLHKQLTALEQLPLPDLLASFREMFGKEPGTSNRTSLLRKLAFGLQERCLGGFDADTRKLLDTLLAEYSPLNHAASRPDKMKRASRRDRRLPMPGTSLTRSYKGVEHRVSVLENGFEFKSVIYKSLTAVAYEITGTHTNGYAFFNL